MRYFAPALILVFAFAGCVSPEEKAAAEARAQARVDSLARQAEERRELFRAHFRAQARVDSLAKEEQARAVEMLRAQARADSLAREEQARAAARAAERAAERKRRGRKSAIQELVAQAYEANARGASLSWEMGSRERQQAQDARRNQEYALAMAADAKSNAWAARHYASNATAEAWDAWNRAAELWERVAEARDALEALE